MRKQNAKLKVEIAEKAKSSQSTTNHFQITERPQLRKFGGMVADDPDARSSAEWRSFLLNALKALNERDRDAKELYKRLSLLKVAAREQLLQKEQGPSPSQDLLENEIAEAEKLLLRFSREPQDFLVKQPESVSESRARVMAVRLDLGVAAMGIGRKLGVRVGMPFVVVRGKEAIALLMVAEVREDLSLVLIEQMDPEKPLLEGDVAHLRGR
jgi:hypothetical protein